VTEDGRDRARLAARQQRVPRPYADLVTTLPDDVSDAVAAITARLAARHDALTILRAVTDACGPLLSADAAGVLVADPRGDVAVAAASDERAQFVELLQAQVEQGPCVDCISDNAQVTSVDLDKDSARWPQFANAALEAGFRSVYAFPMRLVSHAAGGLNVLYNRRTKLPANALRLGQALADLAMLGLTQERDERRVERLAEQTLTALNDRIVVSQAAGMLVGALGLTPDGARARMAAHATASGRSLRDVARAITDGSLGAAAVGGSAAG
jgi:transcriptional regulator with GAF, ATPase, and Fis domain